jgi:membrane associated rhomboid family serine protease
VISEADYDFLQTVWNRRPLFTYLFFGINIAVFVLMTLAGGTTNESTLLAFGVKSNVMIDQGEYWRFITPIFIHIGLLHLFFNSYALWIVGPQVERLYGGARFVLLYVLTGVAGVIGSYVYRPDGLSAGASGAIFGLFGVLLVFGIRHRHNIPPFFRRTVGTGVLPIILINLVIGYTIPQIDNSAHVSGLLAGMALAAIIPFERPGTKTPPLFTAIQWILIGCILLSCVEVIRHYDGPRLSIANVYRSFRSGNTDFSGTVNRSQEAFDDSLSALRSGDKDEIARAAHGVTQAIDQLQDIPTLASRPDELMAQVLVVMQDQYALLKDVERTGTVTLMHARRASENTKRYRELMDSFFEWVQSEGKGYGIQLRQPH